jgi:predicted O-methyltransferase YrrM
MVLGRMVAPLLSLVMIVKDEAASIEATVASVKPWVDRYSILDTGSRDGTPELIRGAFADTPGEVLTEPFVDYGATRSRILQLADGSATFLLMLSGDETLRGGEALRRFCEAHQGAEGHEHTAYQLQMLWGDIRFELPRLTRSGGGWRYYGRTHELLAKEGAPFPPIRIPGVAIHHDVAHRDQERKKSTWRNDLKILTEDVAANPGDSRAAFYLARTYDDLGRSQEAHAAYLVRLGLGGDQLEVYESLLGLARTTGALGRPWAEVQQRYLEAFAHTPNRAEPLLDIADHWLREGSFALSHLFSSRAAAIPCPVDGIVRPGAYGWARDRLLGLAAAELERWEEAELPLRSAASAVPDDPYVLRALSRTVHRRARAARHPSPQREDESLLLPLRVIAQMQTVPGYFTVPEGELIMSAAAEALRRTPPGTEVLEIGSYFGRSTVVLAEVVRAVRPGARVYSVDPHVGAMDRDTSGRPPREADTWQTFLENLQRFDLQDFVVPLRQYSYEVEWRAPLAFLFIDGLHDEASVTRDYELFAQFLAPGGLVAFHDYSESWPGVVRLLDRLVAEKAIRFVQRADSLVIAQKLEATHG